MLTLYQEGHLEKITLIDDTQRQDVDSRRLAVKEGLEL